MVENNEITTMRISKELLQKLETEKNTIEGVSSNEEMVEYLLVKHLIFEGKQTKEIVSNMKMKVAEELELTENFPLASYGAMRAALWDVVSPSLIAFSHLTIQEFGIEEEVAEKIQKKFQEQFDNIIEKYNIDLEFLDNGQ